MQVTVACHPWSGGQNNGKNGGAGGCRHNTYTCSAVVGPCIMFGVGWM